MLVPIRIQRTRKSGSKQPANTKYCGRPGKWGNPFIAVQTIKGPDRYVVFEISGTAGMRQICQSIIDNNPAGPFFTKLDAQAHVARLFGILLDTIPEIYPVHELAKYQHLSCWCKVGEPCHVDEIINRIKSQNLC